MLLHLITWKLKKKQNFIRYSLKYEKYYNFFRQFLRNSFEKLFRSSFVKSFLGKFFLMSSANVSQFSLLFLEFSRYVVPNFFTKLFDFFITNSSKFPREILRNFCGQFSKFPCQILLGFLGKFFGISLTNYKNFFFYIFLKKFSVCKS